MLWYCKRSRSRSKMKILGWDPMASMKRRIACSGTTSSTSSYIKLHKRETSSQECSERGSFLLIKQLFWKVRAKWNQYCLKRQRRNTINFSYDAKSYFQNFDSGHPHDRPSPFAPWNFLRHLRLFLSLKLGSNFVKCAQYSELYIMVCMTKQCKHVYE